MITIRNHSKLNYIDYCSQDEYTQEEIENDTIRNHSKLNYIDYCSQDEYTQEEIENDKLYHAPPGQAVSLLRSKLAERCVQHTSRSECHALRATDVSLSEQSVCSAQRDSNKTVIYFSGNMKRNKDLGPYDYFRWNV